MHLKYIKRKLNVPGIKLNVPGICHNTCACPQGCCVHSSVMKNINCLATSSSLMHFQTFLKSNNFIPVFVVYLDIVVLFIHDKIAAKIIASINRPSKNYFCGMVKKIVYSPLKFKITQFLALRTLKTFKSWNAALNRCRVF